MPDRIKNILPGIFLLIVFAAGALSADDNEIESSHKKAPDWVTVVPQADREYYYFVGRASGKNALEDAETDAVADAIRQVVTMIGLDVKVDYDRLRKEAEVILDDRLVSRGAARISGIKVMESYHRRQAEYRAAELRHIYEAAVLVRWPKGELEMERNRLEQDAVARVSSATRLFRQGLDYESREETFHSLDCFRDALRELDHPSTFMMPQKMTVQYEEIKKMVEDAARRLSFKTGNVSVDQVVVSGSEDESFARDNSLTESLIAALSERGFIPQRLDRNSADFESRVIAEAAIKDEGYTELDEGFVMSRWTVTVGLVDNLNKDIVVHEIYSVKGFGMNRERAAADALRKVRFETFDRFALDARRQLDQRLSEEETNVYH